MACFLRLESLCIFLSRVTRHDPIRPGSFTSFVQSQGIYLILCSTSCDDILSHKHHRNPIPRKCILYQPKASFLFTLSSTCIPAFIYIFPDLSSATGATTARLFSTTRPLHLITAVPCSFFMLMPFLEEQMKKAIKSRHLTSFTVLIYKWT